MSVVQIELWREGKCVWKLFADEAIGFVHEAPAGVDAFYDEATGTAASIPRLLEIDEIRVGWPTRLSVTREKEEK